MGIIEDEVEWWPAWSFLWVRACQVVKDVGQAMLTLQDQRATTVSEELLLVIKQGIEELHDIRKLLRRIPQPRGPRKEELLDVQWESGEAFKDYIESYNYVLKHLAHQETALRHIETVRQLLSEEA